MGKGGKGGGWGVVGDWLRTQDGNGNEVWWRCMAGVWGWKLETGKEHGGGSRVWYQHDRSGLRVV